MHPAASVIFFTTASGAGYGMLVLLGLLGAAGALPPDSGLGFLGFLIALGLVTLGLLSSTFHLGHPERAWRAFSQWRTSWLSREGVLAVATYLPVGLFAIGWVFLERNGGVWGVFGLLGAVLALVTVYSTSMIYASLKTIRHWHNPWVPPVYLALALATGGVWLSAVAASFGHRPGSLLVVTMIALAAGLGVKLLYWRSVDGDAGSSTSGTATGLGSIGTVRQLEAPHTQDNWVMREMGHKIARKHAAKLRRIAIVLTFILPLGLLPLAALGPGALAIVAAWLATLAVSLGVLVERWLFFAEARHVVTLYYGEMAA